MQGESQIFLLMIPKLQQQVTILKYIITETLNSDLNIVGSWLSANKLTLNNSKAEYMIIGSKYRLGLVTSDPAINVGNLKINRVETTKSLGLMIDESLNWSAHVDHIFKKVASIQVSQFSGKFERC